MASTLVIGLLAAVSVLFTNYVLDVPIWVVFIAWASYFAAGGGPSGARSTLVMGMAGVVSATITLLVANAMGGEAWVVALCCIGGAGVLAAISGIPWLSFTPAGFLGFASTAGTIAATGSAVNDPVSWQHPSVLVAGAFVVGVAFGMASEYLPALLTGSAGAPATA
ncbi:DUF1097 domain-containing protein [Gordonia metallireducens]|uniref:DUF1097 domain-containing protein n=1 Tax=Gordonia metallireducens TaxID=2897779 RepID=UPI001E481E16|nr:DUF1097 domain-containing protein [Gordonia metallireducens]